MFFGFCPGVLLNPSPQHINCCSEVIESVCFADTCYESGNPISSSPAGYSDFTSKQIHSHMIQNFLLSFVCFLFLCFSGFAQEYCTPQHINCCSEVIESVCFADTCYESGNPISSSPAGYSDFTSKSFTVSRGNFFSGTVSPNYGFDDSNFNVWVDFDQNGVFEGDELVVSTTGQGPYPLLFEIPEDAALGATRIRFRFQFGPNYTPNPCQGTGFTMGETEDFTLIVQEELTGNELDPGSQTFSVQDKWGNELDTLYLVDWEGYLANPAIEVQVNAPGCASVELSMAGVPRAYFNSPSIAGSNGPSKELFLGAGFSGSALVSIWPDRDGEDEVYSLSIRTCDTALSLPVVVIDQDLTDPIVEFPLHFDYSQDDRYNFFDVPKRRIAEQAANDIAYFLKDMNYDEVPAGAQESFIFTDTLRSVFWVKNPVAYTGFYLYIYGIHREQNISSGSPSSFNAFQTINGVATSLRRSGQYLSDPFGDYDTMGWDTTINSETWFHGTNVGRANDLYSIALHEIGHVMCFEALYPKFAPFEQQQSIDAPQILKYYGGPVPLSWNHMYDEANNKHVVDPMSRQGVFGSEYAVEMPLGRWILTKLNLLVMEAIGYELRETSAFIPLSLRDSSLSNAEPQAAYSAQIMPEGGTPIYHFELIDGQLPEGLFLDPQSGRIQGTAQNTGTYAFTIQVEEYGGDTAQAAFEIQVGELTTSSDDLLEDAKPPIYVLPNPANDRLSIINLEGSAWIYTLTGQRLMEVNRQELVDISKLPTGLYFVRVEGGSAGVLKFLKK